ncbi:MAG: hypothetical protein BWY77_01563 [bacterium ADurb.Bin431]|nr:MAG: hypothetical protein BWY77_01563 [bacterium ADurb.Bin431]
MRIIGEGFAQHLFDLGLELLDQLLEVFGGHVGIRIVALGLFQFGHDVLELMADALALCRLDAGSLFHHHIGVHHDEAAIGVVGETLVAGLFDQTLDGLAGETDIEDGLHHARHGAARAGADREQKGVLDIAEAGVHDLFDRSQGSLDILHQLGGILFAVGVIVSAHLGGDGKAGGDRDAEVGHLRQVGALAAEQFLHLGCSFSLAAAEGIDIFGLGHSSLLKCHGDWLGYFLVLPKSLLYSSAFFSTAMPLITHESAANRVR